MSVKLGIDTAYFRLGTQPAKVFLGDVVVQTVPGVPVIDGANTQNGTTGVTLFLGTDDGGSAITSYEFTFDDVPVVPANSDLQTLTFIFSANYAGQDVRVRAVNAVGAGPYSEPAVVG
jgi:hypothetical protein